ncbi:MAG: cation:proton antiporter [Phycisphaerales bacterium]
MTNFELSVRLFLQLAIILAVCRAVGFLARRLGQPQVVGEMIAGVALGPSLFGLLAPEVSAWLFPKESLTVIYCLSQIGLVLYMFLVGLDFRVDLIRKRLHSAASVSLAGIITPFALGSAIALWLVNDDRLFAPEVTRSEAVLFLGAAMSITAFPMLARIIYERGLSNTSYGALALAAGSMDDAAAWCVLALVLASFSGEPSVAIFAIGGGVIYAIITLTLGRRLMQPLGDVVERTGALTPPIMAFVLALVMLAAWFTDAIGIYAVFGAFILGAAMPRGHFSESLEQKIEPLTTNFLLPLFFVYSGLNTRIGLVNTASLWFIAIVILLAATFGKGIACWWTARRSGEGPREAIAIGALMNARGLMELIILNIGLERAIIRPALFSVMVIMAIVTTLMATPIFEFVLGKQLVDRGDTEPRRPSEGFPHDRGVHAVPCPPDLA